MKNKTIKLLTLAAVGSICWLGIKNYPVPQEIEFPIGPLVVCDGGMTNRSFTNRCVFLWKDTNSVLHLKNVTVVNAHTAFWLVNARSVEMDGCAAMFSGTGFRF